MPLQARHDTLLKSIRNGITYWAGAGQSEQLAFQFNKIHTPFSWLDVLCGELVTCPSVALDIFFLGDFSQKLPHFGPGPEGSDLYQWNGPTGELRDFLY